MPEVSCGAPDSGSRVALDLQVPEPCSEEEIPRLARRLEGVSHNYAAEADAVAVW